MALMITDDCTGCSVCEPECPNDAISENNGVYAIDPNKCTECVGHHDESQCVPVCPVDAIVPDSRHRESKDKLLQKFQQLAGQAA